MEFIPIITLKPIYLSEGDQCTSCRGDFDTSFSLCIGSSCAKEVFMVYRARKVLAVVKKFRNEERGMGEEWTDAPIAVVSTSKYEFYGRMSEKLRVGFGTQIWYTNSIYRGYWSNDLPQSFGILLHSSGNYYRGYWNAGQAEGIGFYYDNQAKSTYEGEWHMDKKHGSGCYRTSDAQMYIGHYVSNKKSGQGTLKLSNKDQYIGTFLEDKFHGKGIYTWADGRKYEGEWREGKMDGKGKYSWPEDNQQGRRQRKYEGSYRDGKREGRGKFVWSDGSWYDGIWVDGKQEDEHGLFCTASGIERSGHWHNGVLVQFLGRTNSASPAIPASSNS